jgi:hypothetical protein
MEVIPWANQRLFVIPKACCDWARCWGSKQRCSQSNKQSKDGLALGRPPTANRLHIAHYVLSFSPTNESTVSCNYEHNDFEWFKKNTKTTAYVVYFGKVGTNKAKQLKSDPNSETTRRRPSGMLILCSTIRLSGPTITAVHPRARLRPQPCH